MENKKLIMQTRRDWLSVLPLVLGGLLLAPTKHTFSAQEKSRVSTTKSRTQLFG